MEALPLRGQPVHLGDADASRIGNALLIGSQQQCVATESIVSPRIESHLRASLVVISGGDLSMEPLSLASSHRLHQRFLPR